MHKIISSLGKLERVFAALALLGAMLGGSAKAQSPEPMLGEVIGDDISVVGPSNLAPGENSQTIEFASGSTIIVHSGKARVEFNGGGELDVCGPAKFTVLASGEALTVALSFGRVHAKLDSLRPLAIFTPLVIAKPMALEDQPRDMTLGLTDAGTMCLLAARGAVQVQQQLSGQTLLVPQPSEVLLESASLGAFQAAGSCRCDFDEAGALKARAATVVAQRPAPIVAAPSIPAPPVETPKQSPQTAATIPSAFQPQAIAAQAAKSAPVNPRSAEVTEISHAPAQPAAAWPLAKQPELKIELPPIAYNAKAEAAAPGDTISVATLLLAKDAIVEPEWIFHGQVTAPERPARTVKTKEKRKKEGFWAKLHDFFFGRPQKTPCAGRACG